MTDTSAQVDSSVPSGATFYIGSYVLESLTTGMYVEPRDSIREYVQNAFDAIERARQLKLLAPHEGEIKIVVSEAHKGSIVIWDDGVSISHAQVWETLTSIGASRKDPRRQAGFRGIGRLAGIAYCRRLEFVCKAAGETVESTVVYNCETIKQGLSDGSDLDALFRQSISFTTADNPASADSHYTYVRMLGTDAAPKELTDIGQLAEYLRNIAPVDFAEQWSFADEIKAKAKEDGFSIPVVKLSIGTGHEDLEEIRKPYANSMAAGRRQQTLQGIKFHKGVAPGGAKWWGWYGQTPLYGAIAEPEVAGIRMRVKNIQLDGKEIIARIMRASAYSYERFQAWHLGEVYVDTGVSNIFPNARRDGFEDSVAWNEMELQIRSYLDPLIAETYKASSARNSKAFDKVFKDTELEIGEITSALQEVEKPEPEMRKVLSRKIRANLKKVESLNLDNYTEEQQADFRNAAVRLRALAETAQVKIAPARARKVTTEPDAEPDDQPYRAFLDIAFEVISPLVDTRTFNRIRKALTERFKGG
jgi:hypothetical protein